MKCLEISVNGILRWRAGIKNASMLGPRLSACVDGEHPARLMVTGMCDLPGDRVAHVYWCNELELDVGDTVSLKLVEGEDPTAPQEILATDSPEYIEEQRRFEEFETNFVAEPAPRPRKYGELAL